MSLDDLQPPERQEFDLNDPANIGRPFYFSLSDFIRTIQQYICADEIHTAIYLLDNPPGWFRDHYPPELTAIKKRLYERCYDPYDYASDFDEANFTYPEIVEQCLTGYTYPRADILYKYIEELNANGEAPWVCELSPSHGWLPLGFSKRGLKFNFFGKNLNQPALKKIKEWLPKMVWEDSPQTKQHKILVCFESLEHMWNPHDLTQSAYKIGQEFDAIFLSTPKYTLGGGLPDWKTRRIGHVRTWCPKEFLEFANKSFPGYSWEYYDSHSMVLKGVK